MFGKKDEEEYKKLAAMWEAPENPTKEDLIKALAQLGVFLITVQVDQLTKNMIIGWYNTVSNYLKKSTEIGKDLEDALRQESWR